MLVSRQFHFACLTVACWITFVIQIFHSCIRTSESCWRKITTSMEVGAMAEWWSPGSRGLCSESSLRASRQETLSAVVIPSFRDNPQVLYLPPSSYDPSLSITWLSGVNCLSFLPTHWHIDFCLQPLQSRMVLLFKTNLCVWTLYLSLPSSPREGLYHTHFLLFLLHFLSSHLHWLLLLSLVHIFHRQAWDIH